MRALLFDVFGTLVDWRASVVAEAAEAGRRAGGAPPRAAGGAGVVAGAAEAGRRAGVAAGWPAVVDDWRRAYPGAMERARSEPVWRDLDALQRGTLDDVLARHGVALPAGEREVLVRS